MSHNSRFDVLYHPVTPPFQFQFHAQEIKPPQFSFRHLADEQVSVWPDQPCAWQDHDAGVNYP